MAGLVAPCVVVIAPAGIVLVALPFCAAAGLRAMTWTVIVQEPPAGIVPPLKDMVAGLTAGADAVAVPLAHVVAALLGGRWSARPAGCP